MAQRPPNQRASSASEVITGFTQGLQQYLDPTLTKPQQWYSSSNVYSGMFGYAQRARWASVVANPSVTTYNILPSTSPGITNQGFTGANGTNIAITTSTTNAIAVGQYVQVTGTSNNTGLSNPPYFDGFYRVTAVLSTTQFVVLWDSRQNGLPNFCTGGGGTVKVNPSGGYIPQGTPFTTLKYYAIPQGGGYLLGDVNGRQFSFDTGNSYFAVPRPNPYYDITGAGSSLFNGPWSREVLSNIVYEMNGQVKQTGRGAYAATVESFGLDAPDVTPQVTITSGSTQNITALARSNGIVTATLAAALTVPGGNGLGFINVVGVTDTSFNGTFVVLTGSGTTTLTWAQAGQNTTPAVSGAVNYNITKSVGRSYAWAWENANKSHVGPPSPVTQYIQYSSQYGTIQCIEQGTVQATGGSQVVTGTGTAFTSAWVGRSLWIASGDTNMGPIASVQSATQLTLEFPAAAGSAPVSFQVFDPSATHIRLYYTADGGATYYRTQRNAWVPSANNVAASGLQFFDAAAAEPPNFPYTTETSQLYNIPPPIGSFIKEYQGSLIVYGVAGAPATFFYSNTSLTSVGLQQESFAPLNQVTLPIQNASINGMAECPGSLIIWSDKQDMFRLTGLLTDNTAATATQQGATITALPYNLGCASPYAVALTPLGVIWLTANSEVWLYTDRYAPRNIGRPITQILKNIPEAQLSQARAAYYHIYNRDWFVLSVANGSANNVLCILDLEQLASNGSPSYFIFDMATNQPAWYQYNLACPTLEVVYESSGAVRLLTGATDLITDVDFTAGNFGTELAVPNAFLTLHPWGNDSAQIIKRPTWFRFGTNRPPNNLQSDGWSFNVKGIDDDYYTFFSPLSLGLVPGVNDASTLGGNPNLSTGSPFRHSPELYKIGGVNFVMGRRLQFTVNFPSSTGVDYQLRQVQIGFGPSPPR